jgi:aminoglycoside phosphotransferase family enzyme
MSSGPLCVDHAGSLSRGGPGRHADSGRPAIVTFLERPDIYPDHPRRVEVVETHKSWVFLTKRFAWKLKKPIRYNSVDFRTPEARHADCLAEVRLNRELAPGVYRGVVALTADADGRLVLGGDGEPIDWLVQMRRLPADRMLEHLIAERAVTQEDVRRIALHLATFCRHRAPLKMSGEWYRERLGREIERNRRELSDPVFGLPLATVRTVHERQTAFLREQSQLFDSRVRAGRVIEGHGDLRPAHVCLLDDGPVVFDCLEFDRDLRIVDAADELAFLAMECERAGAPFVGPLLFAAYATEIGDCPPRALIAFYTSHRAATWARLALWRARELPPRARTKWLKRAADYLHVADHYSRVLASDV